MHKTIRIAVSLLLSAFILLGGSGMVIGKMVCLRSGHTVYDVKTMEDCCDKTEKGTWLRNNCCDISNLSFHQSSFLSQENTSLKAPLTVKIIFASASVFCSNLFTKTLPENASFPDPLPDRISAERSLTGVYRI